MKHPPFYCIRSQMTSDEFTKLYSNRNLTVKEIAKQLHVNTSSIQLYANHLNLTLRNKNRKPHHRGRIAFDTFDNSPWWISQTVVELIIKEQKA